MGTGDRAAERDPTARANVSGKGAIRGATAGAAAIGAPGDVASAEGC